MRDAMRRILRILTPWWDEGEADAKSDRTDSVSRNAHAVTTDANLVIASYRAASRIAGDQRLRK